MFHTSFIVLMISHLSTVCISSIH